MRTSAPLPYLFHVIRDYRDLRVWVAAMDLAQELGGETEPLAPWEGGAGEIAVSVPSNIAEGQARDSNPDFLRFLAIAAGSLAEVRTQLLLAARLQYTAETHEPQIDELARQLTALRAAIKRKEVEG